MKKEGRLYRHKRIRKRIMGDSKEPRLVVFRSGKHIYAQLVNDCEQRVITGVSTLSKTFKEKGIKSTDKKGAYEIGKLIAQKAKDLNITRVHFDRAGYKYHGRVKALAEGAREGGLKF